MSNTLPPQLHEPQKKSVAATLFRVSWDNAKNHPIGVVAGIALVPVISSIVTAIAENPRSWLSAPLAVGLILGATVCGMFFWQAVATMQETNDRANEALRESATAAAATALTVEDLNKVIARKDKEHRASTAILRSEHAAALVEARGKERTDFTGDIQRRARKIQLDCWQRDSIAVTIHSVQISAKGVVRFQFLVTNRSPLNFFIESGTIQMVGFTPEGNTAGVCSFVMGEDREPLRFSCLGDGFGLEPFESKRILATYMAAGCGSMDEGTLYTVAFGEFHDSGGDFLVRRAEDGARYHVPIPQTASAPGAQQHIIVMVSAGDPSRDYRDLLGPLVVG